MIAAPVGGDDEIGLEARREGLHQHMNAFGIARAADGVADHLAYGVAGRDGGQSLARLKREVDYLIGCCQKPLEGATQIGGRLDRVIMHSRLRRLERAGYLSITPPQWPER